MDYGKAFRQYKRSSIETADKLELVIMCYDKTILCLQQAQENLGNCEIEKKVHNIQKALDIISELQSSLNFDKGDKIAKSLDSLYTYLTNRIILADIQKDFSIFNECINILNELKSGWEGIKTEKEEPAPIDNSTSQEIPRLSHQIAV
ncbi:MAG: flagellar export chaperone FliS [Desulfobacteraceae bacterium]|jgi:flagellar protein FliS